MVSEAEILQTFLLERASFEEMLSLRSFRKLFPKGTSQELIEALYKHFEEHASATNKTIEANIQKFLAEKQEASQRLSKDQLEHLQQNSTLRNINNKFLILNKILDQELEGLQAKHRAQIERINQRNAGLMDTVLSGPSSKYPTDLSEPLDELLLLLKSLSE